MRRIFSFALCAVFVSAVSAARADIVTALSAAPTAVAGGYAYTYDVELSGGQLDAVSNGTPVQFGTVYDFGQGTLVGTTGYLATSFLFSMDNTNTAAFATAPIDSASLANVRFTYKGTDNLVVSGSNTTKTTFTPITAGIANLGTFTIVSPYGTTRTGAFYDGQSYKGTNDTVQGNVGTTSVPDTTVGVTPEPSSLVLLGTGILGMAGVVRRRMV